jgi:hypothetical protein
MRVFRSISLMTAVLVCGLVVAGVRASAQGQSAAGAATPAPAGRQGGAPPTNLKVLPKDIARPALTAMMRGYTGALGVQCNHCHTEDMAARASDDNPKKDIARKMIQMTMDLNKQLDAIGTPAAPDAPKVTCFTCHRGAVKPATAAGGH